MVPVIILLKKYFVDTIPEVNEEKIIIVDNIESAPEILILDDNEKFKDDDGNIINIETRGYRKIDGIYFKVKDVMTCFEMVNLNKHLFDNKSAFTEIIHYKYFNCKKVRKDPKKQRTIKKELYLTYEGILRVLFASHSSKVKTFIKWATETLFTIQLGTIKNKEELISTILGVNAKVIKEVFNTSTNTLPCIYLFTLGTVKELRLTMNINDCIADDSIVAKYGFTKDLSRRTGEHISTYGKITNCDLKLKFHSYIDPQFISSGENDIKLFFDALKIKLDYENNDELVIIPKNLIILVEKQYQQIGKNYMGHISELITKIKELEDKYEKLSLTHQIELQNVKFQNEIQKEKYEKELLKKDIEIMKIQLSNFNL
jgi:hypothetical protein